MAMALLRVKSNKLAADTSPVAIGGSSDSKTQIAPLPVVGFDFRMVYRQENYMLTHQLLKILKKMSISLAIYGNCLITSYANREQMLV
ncbi:hypothetical protein AYM39_03150 [Methylomonas sp. DH-1]|nr:hypothetical protein AYM39_03150 [Methylomonas sp. DH-1]